jgi:hypothetical protein
MEPLSTRPGWVRQVNGVGVAVRVGTDVAVGARVEVGVEVDEIAVGVGWTAEVHAEAANRERRRRRRRRGIDVLCLTGGNPSHYTRLVMRSTSRKPNRGNLGVVLFCYK